MKQIYFAKILVLSCLFSFLKPEKLFAQCTLFITQNPAGQTCSSPALIANYSGIVNPPVPGNKYFICDSHPWNSLIYDTALNNVFGIGNWSLVDYVNANAATIFSAATQFVYIEGSDGNEAEQTAYLAANQAVIEAWVAAGGRLLLNRAPNAGAAITSFGFGGVNNHYTNPQGNVTVTPAHPIGSGPYLPAGYGPYYGASFSHAYISGGNVTPLITGIGVDVLAEKNWGDGLVLFGGYTTPSFWGPVPDAKNLFQNIIDYAANSSQPPAISYAWMPGGETTNAIVANATGIYTVTATQAGCTSTATISVIVNTDIIPNVTVSGTSITANPTGGTPPYQYSINGAPFTANNTFDNLCTGNYFLTVKDNFGNGCLADTVVAIQNLIVTNIAETACFSYYFNGNNITTSGVYADTLMNAFGCDSIISLNLTINTVNNGITQVGTLLTADATGAAYQWLDCNANTLITGEVSQSYFAMVNGDYAVIVTQNGCTDTSECKNAIISGIEDHNAQTVLNIYPNPASDVVYIESEKEFSEVIMYDLQMKKVTSMTISLSKKAELNIKDLKEGIYFIKTNNGQIRKLIIRK